MRILEAEEVKTLPLRLSVPEVEGDTFMEICVHDGVTMLPKRTLKLTSQEAIHLLSLCESDRTLISKAIAKHKAERDSMREM